MENSNNINKEEFDVLKLYAKGIIDEYNFAKDGSRASLMTFNEQPNILVNIEDEISKNDLKILVDSVMLSNSENDDLVPVFKELKQLIDEQTNDVDRNVPANVLLLLKRMNKFIFCFNL